MESRISNGIHFSTMLFQASDCWVVVAHTRVAWRFTFTTNGVWCVATTGEERMLQLSAVSWDSPAVPHWKTSASVPTFIVIGWAMSGASETIGVDKTIIMILGTYCLVEAPLTPSSLFASCRRSTSQLRNYAFVDSEKAFNCMLRKVPWALKSVGGVLKGLESCAGQ